MIALLLAVVSLTAIAPASDPPTPRKRSPAAEQAVAAALDRRSRVIEIIVVGDAEDGVAGAPNVVELGRVSYRPPTGAARSAARGSPAVTLLRRVVTVRIGTERTGFAPLRAHLQTVDGRCRIRVDGTTLTAVPQVIDPLAPLGQAVAHVLEIEIPTTATEGPVAASISWTSDPP
jgi:hypothetical protein